MISSISGKIQEVGGNFVVINIGNLGYKVYVAADLLRELTVGKEAHLSTHLAVREDALDLYGFASLKEKNIFELLITISGIGPKSALNILSSVSPDTLISAIRSGSTAHLTKISGIGRKTAEKIVLELKDKVSTIHGGDSTSSGGLASDLDAIEALTSLGYNVDESREALKKISPKITDVGAKVTAALKLLS